MNFPDDPWLTLMLAALLGLVLFLSATYPNASARAKTSVLMIAAVVFLAICNAFATPTKAASRVRTERIETRAAR